jgi:hypothetical protein
MVQSRKDLTSMTNKSWKCDEERREEKRRERRRRME